MSLKRAAVIAVSVSLVLSIGCGEPATAPDTAPIVPAVATAAAGPVAPTALSTSVSSYSAITLAWTDNSSDETGFEVWRSTSGPSGTFSLRKTLAANTTTLKDTGLTPGRQACYKVRAKGTTPSGYTNVSCATTPLRPPGSLAATVSAPTTVTLSWTDNNTTELGFEVWRSTTGTSGAYSLLTTVAANTTSWDHTGRTPGKQYCYKVRAVGADTIPPSNYSNKSCATIPAPLVVRIVLFGDSNTDRCPDQSSVPGSYISFIPRLGPTDPHPSCTVAGKVKATWEAIRSEPIIVVNHAISSSTSGGNTHTAGDANRTGQGSPNARFKVGGTTRFEAEVLGKGYPWSGGEPTNKYFPAGALTRVNAFTPGANDFAYVSMGTNDDAGPTRTLTAAQTEANLRWMAQKWIDAGHAPDHFILTTLAPRDDANSPTSITDRNTRIRALAEELGVHLIDLAAFTSDDNGATWRDPSLNIGDGVHYTEPVRAWLGDQIASWLSSKAPA